VDLARGFALLGILLMNSISFALPSVAYDDPSVIGGSTKASIVIWAINYILFEGKMRALFSMLFGAGVIIFTSRLEERGAGVRTADLFLRRTMWLILFGMLHAYFFWVGDILYSYGATGLLLFVFRKSPPKWLFIAGVLLMTVPMPKNWVEAHDTQRMHDKAAAADAAQKAGKTLTDEQKKDQEAWQERLKGFKPPKEELDKEIGSHRNGFRATFAFRYDQVPGIESYAYYVSIFFDVCSMMLIGMALFKLGFFSAEWSYGRYAAIALAGYAIGLAINGIVVYRDVHSNFDPLVREWAGNVYQYERWLVAMAHVSVLMIVSKAGFFTFFFSRLAAVGQMALTSYFTHTLVCTTIFDRMKFFGRWERYQVYYVVGAIWVFQLIVSKIWLAHFRFGPVEWVWRSLTYWQRQPMRFAAPEPPAPEIDTGGSVAAEVS
jgi:uncharacterized protein